MRHTASTHAPTARSGAQRAPQRPQCSVEVVKRVSHPLARSPSQLPSPALQLATEQLPASHAAVAPAMAHTLLHRPQCDTLLCTSRHASLSQRMNPAGHGGGPTSDASSASGAASVVAS